MKTYCVKMSIGRFFQEDPISFMGGDVNLYIYTRNSPAINTDPLGTVAVLRWFVMWGNSVRGFLASHKKPQGEME
jgi:hypothetical protein